MIKIGFIGFGEVASVLSKEMSSRGADIRVYDILILQKEGLEVIRNRIDNKKIKTCSLEEVIKHSDYILSTVHSQIAKDVALSCEKLLYGPNKVYIDLNSTSPFIKIEISKIIQGTKADFVEGSILGAIGVTGPKTVILTTGKRGKEVAEILNKLGLNVSFYSSEIGKASMFKMLRSIFSKGLETLILECLIAAKKAGIEKVLWDDITSFMSKKSFDKIAANWIQTHAIAYERRYHEMVQVVETMKELGLEPIMTLGTEAFFKRSLSLKLSEEFIKKPDSIEEVINFIEKKIIRA